MRNYVERYQLDAPKEQERLRKDLMEAYHQFARQSKDSENVLFKVSAADEQGSRVTVTMFKSGSLLVVGSGSLFDLTHNVCSLHHRGINNKISRRKP